MCSWSPKRSFSALVTIKRYEEPLPISRSAGLPYSSLSNCSTSTSPGTWRRSPRGASATSLVVFAFSSSLALASPELSALAGAAAVVEAGGRAAGGGVGIFFGGGAPWGGRAAPSDHGRARQAP